MNWFLDMCILIFYARSDEEQSKKVSEFIENKKDNKFILCEYISKKNLPDWIKRQKIIMELFRAKISNPIYDFEKNLEYNRLLEKDKIILKKILSSFALSSNKEAYAISFRKNHEIMIYKIDNFVSKFIDKEVIPISEIDSELKNALFDLIKNHSDSNILSSGIQYNQKEDITLISGDKKDWTKENLQWVYDYQPALSKKYPKIPEIKQV